MNSRSERASDGCSDHDHDLVAELSRRLDNLWRYDQDIANAEWRNDLRQFWMDAKAMEQQAISRLKQLMAQEVRGGSVSDLTPRVAGARSLGSKKVAVARSCGRCEMSAVSVVGKICLA